MAVRPIDGDALRKELTCNFAGEPFHGNRKVTIGEVRRIIESMPTHTPQNEWISVEDRLPEGHMQVLMWSAKWGIAEAGSYYNSRFWVYNELGDGYVGDRITHWMPLPAPPNRRPPEGEEDT